MQRITIDTAAKPWKVRLLTAHTPQRIQFKQNNKKITEWRKTYSLASAARRQGEAWLVFEHVVDSSSNCRVAPIVIEKPSGFFVLKGVCRLWRLLCYFAYTRARTHTHTITRKCTLAKIKLTLVHSIFVWLRHVSVLSFQTDTLSENILIAPWNCTWSSWDWQLNERVYEAFKFRCRLIGTTTERATNEKMDWSTHTHTHSTETGHTDNWAKNETEQIEKHLDGIMRPE